MAGKHLRCPCDCVPSTVCSMTKWTFKKLHQKAGLTFQQTSTRCRYFLSQAKVCNDMTQEKKLLACLGQLFSFISFRDLLIHSVIFSLNPRNHHESSLPSILKVGADCSGYGSHAPCQHSHAHAGAQCVSSTKYLSR